MPLAIELRYVFYKSRSKVNYYILYTYPIDLLITFCCDEFCVKFTIYIYDYLIQCTTMRRTSSSHFVQPDQTSARTAITGNARRTMLGYYICIYLQNIKEGKYTHKAFVAVWVSKLKTAKIQSRQDTVSVFLDDSAHCYLSKVEII